MAPVGESTRPGHSRVVHRINQAMRRPHSTYPQSGVLFPQNILCFSPVSGAGDSEECDDLLAVPGLTALGRGLMTPRSTTRGLAIGGLV